VLKSSLQKEIKNSNNNNKSVHVISWPSTGLFFFGGGNIFREAKFEIHGTGLMKVLKTKIELLNVSIF